MHCRFAESAKSGQKFGQRQIWSEPHLAVFAKKWSDARAKDLYIPRFNVLY